MSDKNLLTVSDINVHTMLIWFGRTKMFKKKKKKTVWISQDSDFEVYI